MNRNDFVLAAGDLNEQARNEGAKAVRQELKDILASGTSPEMALLHLAEELLYDDDSWSGRTNDVRRAYDSGRREELRTAISMHRHKARRDSCAA